MAQKILGQKLISEDLRKSKKAYSSPQKIVSAEVETPRQKPVPETHDAHDDYLWDTAIANSMDAIRELADKALADKRAGRTKKITI